MLSAFAAAARARASPSLLNFPAPAAALASGTSLQQVRCISEEQLGASPERVAELFERSLQRATRKRAEPQPPGLLTTRRESLGLYREILRYSALFVWRDERGRVWRDVIRKSARGEAVAAQHAKPATAPRPLHQPLMYARMLSSYT
jgi:hypothetical protein